MRVVPSGFIHTDLTRVAKVMAGEEFMARITFKAYKGNQLQETSYTSQQDVREAKVILYRKLLEERKLTHVEVYSAGVLVQTMVPMKKEGKDGHENT